MSRLRILIALSSLVAAMLAVLAETPAQAATLTYQTVNSASTLTHSSTGKALHVSVSAQGSPGSTTNVQVSLSDHGISGYGETHIFSFSLNGASSVMSYSKSTGKGKVATGTQLSPMGKLSLTFTKTKQTSSKCQASGSETFVTGTLHGTFLLKSGTHWGKVGSATKRFTFATPNSWTLLYGCSSGEGGTTCNTSTSWNGPQGPNGFGAGSFSFRSGGKTITTISGGRSVLLSAPAGAYRYDSLTQRAPNPSTTSTSLKASGKAGSRITGSAKLGNGSVTTNHVPCKINGHKHTETLKAHSQAKYTSTAGHHFVFHFAATPDVTMPGSGQGSWTVVSYN